MVGLRFVSSCAAPFLPPALLFPVTPAPARAQIGPIPQTIAVRPVVQVATGAAPRCDNPRSAGLWCWGAQKRCVSDTASGGSQSNPVRLTRVTDRVPLANVSTRSRALTAGGEVWFRVHDETGQPGEGTTTDHLFPVRERH
jgi:hypothetical protein